MVPFEDLIFGADESEKFRPFILEEDIGESVRVRDVAFAAMVEVEVGFLAASEFSES